MFAPLSPSKRNRKKLQSSSPFGNQCLELLENLESDLCDIDAIIQILTADCSLRNNSLADSSSENNYSPLFKELFDAAVQISREYFDESEKDVYIQQYTCVIRCALLFDKTRRKCLDFVFDLLNKCSSSTTVSLSTISGSGSSSGFFEQQPSLELSGRLVMSVLSEVHSTLYHFRHTTSLLTLETQYKSGKQPMNTLLIFDEEIDRVEKRKESVETNGAEMLEILLAGSSSRQVDPNVLNSSILHILRDIKEFTKEKITIVLSSNSRQANNINGNIAFLELMPIMITTCQSLSAQLSTSEIYEENPDKEIINFILEKPWRPEYFTSLLNIFLDVKIEDNSNVQAVPSKTDLSGLVQVLLKLAEQYNTAQNFSNLEYIQVIKYVFNKCATNNDSRLNLYYIIQSALQYSLPLLNIVMKSIEQFYVTKPEGVNKCSIGEHFCDFMILLLAYKNELVKEKVFTHLNRFITAILKHVEPKTTQGNDVFHFFAPTAKSSIGSSSTNSILEEDVEELTETYYVERIIKTACMIELVSEEILSILCEWCRASNRHLNTIGKNGMVFLFTVCPGSRNSILQKVIGSIAEEQTAHQREIHISILESLLEEERVLSCGSTIDRFNDYISAFEEYSYAVSSRILVAILPITDISDYFKGELLGKLEKICVDEKRDKITDKRKLAIFGLCMLLSQRSYESDQVSILLALQQAFKFNDIELKTHLYKSLSDALTRILSPSNTTSRLSHEACEILFQIMKTKLMSCFKINNDTQLYEIDVMKSFDVIYDVEERKFLKQKEPLEDLLKCISNLDKVLKKQNSSVNSSLYEKLFESLTTNIRDVDNLISMLNLGENEDESEIPTYNRLTLILPIIQTIIEERFQQHNTIDKVSIELLEIDSLLQKMEKHLVNKKSKFKPEHLSFNTCTSLCKELCKSILSQSDEWSQSLMISLNSMLDHLTFYCEETKEKISNSFLKDITRKSINEVVVMGKIKECNLELIRCVHSLFRIFIMLYDEEQTKDKLSNSEIVRQFEEKIGTDPLFVKLFSRDESVVEKIRQKILSLLDIFFTGVKLTHSEESTKFIKYLFNMKHLKTILTRTILVEGVEENNESDSHVDLLKNLDFITISLYFCKLVCFEKKRTARGINTYMKLIKTLAGIHPFEISIGVSLNIEEDDMDDETSSSEDEIMELKHRERNKKMANLEPRLRECCQVIEFVIQKCLTSVNSSTLVKPFLMFLLNFSNVPSALDYCRDTIHSCISVFKTSNSQHSDDEEISCDMSNMVKTRESTSKALTVILSYIEFLISKMLKKNTKKGKTSDLYHSTSSFSLPALEANFQNSEEDFILSPSLFEKIDTCLTAALQLVHGDYSEYGSTDQITGKLDKIMTSLCNYVISNTTQFKKKIKKEKIKKKLWHKMNILSQTFKSIFNIIDNTIEMRGSIATAKNNLELDLTKSYTKLEESMEKMCYQIRELNRVYLSKNKKNECKPLEIIEELAKFQFAPSTQDEETPKRKRNLGQLPSSKKRKKSQNLRSKNRYIDHALCAEDEAEYSDTYADLEDWIDDGDWSPSREPLLIHPRGEQ